MSRPSTLRLQEVFAEKVLELVAMRQDPALILAYLGWRNAPAWATAIVQRRPKSLILSAPPKSAGAKLIALAIGIYRLVTNPHEHVRHIYETNASRRESLAILRRFARIFHAPELAAVSKSLGSMELSWNSAYRLTPRGKMDAIGTTLTIVEYPTVYPQITGSGDSITLVEFSKVPGHLSAQGSHWHAICPECLQGARSDLFWRMDALELRCPKCNSDHLPTQGEWKPLSPTATELFHLNSLMDPTSQAWLKALSSRKRKAANRAFGFSAPDPTEIQVHPLRLAKKEQTRSSIKFTEQIFAGIDWGHKRTHLSLTRIEEGQAGNIGLVHLEAFDALNSSGQDDVEQLSAVLNGMNIQSVVHDNIGIGQRRGIALRKLISNGAKIIDASISTGEHDQYISEDAIRVHKGQTAKHMIHALNFGKLLIAQDVFDLQDWPEARQHLSAIRLRLADLKYQVSPRRTRDDFFSSTTLAFLAAEHFAKFVG